MYATFVLVRHADTYFLVFNHGVGSGFAAALKKFLPFYKCSLQLAPEGWACLAAAGAVAMTALAAELGNLPAPGSCAALSSGWLCRLGEQQVLVCTGVAEQSALMQAIAAAVPAAGPQAWQLCELLAGHFPFTPDDIEKYTPQELQLDAHGYVSFSKGCYTGQEIVARMHYRGKVKKQLYLLSTDAADTGLPEADYGVHDKEGMLVGNALKQYRSDSGMLHVLAQLPPGLAEQTDGVYDGNGHALVAEVF